MDKKQISEIDLLIEIHVSLNRQGSGVTFLKMKGDETDYSKQR